MAVPPLAPEQFHQRSKRESINGALRHGQPGTLGVSHQQSEIVPFIAALDVHPKVVPCSLQVGKSCVAFHILADKDAVLITTILIKSTNLNKLTTRFDKYIIATAYGNYFRFLCDKIILTNTSQG